MDLLFSNDVKLMEGLVFMQHLESSIQYLVYQALSNATSLSGDIAEKELSSI
jgi:hypothetical protein